MPRTKSNGGPTKADMVRDALATLGGNPTPKEMQAYIKNKYNTDINAQMLSSYKSNLAGKKKKQGKPGPKPKTVGSTGSSGGGSIGMDELMALRKLISRVGADQVTSLVKVLS